MDNTTYYTNFIVNETTGNVIMMMDFPTAAEAIRDAMEYADIENLRVDRVGPLSTSPFETNDNDLPEERIAY